MRIIIYSTLFLIAFASVERFCHKQTHGFRLHKIASKNLPSREWETTLPADCSAETLKHILSEPFYFLGSGGESYAFSSEDGNYVLKFFKHHHMRPSTWFDHLLPFSLKQKLQKGRIEKRAQFFSSCRLAYERFREGTGLVYLHISPTNCFDTKCKIYDAIGVVHTIDLDTIDFALQKKASMAFPTITSLVEAREIDAAEKRLSSLVDLIVNRCKAGIAEHDARKRNFGFIKTQAIEIDLGSFSSNEKLKTHEATKKVLLMETLRLRRWVKKNHPELSEFLERKIQTSLSKNSEVF